ncbi:MAG: hypothetical protein M1483_04505 [Actinobacteria bacterium]|nr:hypothetical protein [Actinomycetota bacterium]MCL6104874.1 hypothetical protein [Actinomycetota bacterium]
MKFNLYNHVNLFRWITVAALAIVGIVHLNLYAREQYDAIPTIGPLFLATVILSFIFATAFAVRPGRILAGIIACFLIGVFGGYMIALRGNLFAFHEPKISYSGGFGVTAELVGALASVLYTAGRHKDPPLKADGAKE